MADWQLNRPNSQQRRIYWRLSATMSRMMQNNSEPESHTRTVVRECCKGDDASQWENGKFDPLPRPNPLTDRHQKLRT